MLPTPPTTQRGEPYKIFNDCMELLFVKGYPPMQAGKIHYFERPESKGL